MGQHSVRFEEQAKKLEEAELASARQTMARQAITIGQYQEQLRSTREALRKAYELLLDWHAWRTNYNPIIGRSQQYDPYEYTEIALPTLEKALGAREKE